MTRPEYDTNAAGWVLPEYFSEAPPPYTLADLVEMRNSAQVKPYHYAIHTEEETVSDTAREINTQQEIRAAEFRLAKAKEKSARAVDKVRVAEQELKAAEARRRPKEPTARASLGTNYSIPPVVTFRKAGGTYIAVMLPFRNWHLTLAEAGSNGNFSWDKLLEFMGPEGRRTLAVTDASSWHRPEFPA